MSPKQPLNIIPAQPGWYVVAFVPGEDPDCLYFDKEEIIAFGLDPYLSENLTLLEVNVEGFEHSPMPITVSDGYGRFPSNHLIGKLGPSGKIYTHGMVFDDVDHWQSYLTATYNLTRFIR